MSVKTRSRAGGGGEELPIAIIGGGFSGCLLAAHLLRRARRPTRVLLIERGALARGVAYATEEPGHLLNVPAGDMSAWPDAPQDFLRWLRERSPRGEDVGAGTFAPRRLYGLYIESILRGAAESAVPGAGLELVADEAVSIEAGAAAELVLKSGRRIRAARVALALGNLPPSTPAEGGLERLGSRYLPNPWSLTALRSVQSDDPVLMIGTGLTMADVVVSLLSQGHRGPLHAFSRHGLLPRSHGPSAPAEGFPPLGSVRGVLRWLRDQHEASGWRSGMDRLRPRIQELWLSLDQAERRRFLRHARPYWDAHRHRLPPQVHELLSGLVSSGRLRVLAGRLEEARATPRGARATLRLRADGRREAIEAGWIVNCTGPESRPERCADPLIRGLLERGLARPGELGLGFKTDEHGALIGADDRASAVLFTLGPWRKGGLWESLAVLELKVQTQQLAARLLGRPLSS